MNIALEDKILSLFGGRSDQIAMTKHQVVQDLDRDGVVVGHTEIAVALRDLVTAKKLRMTSDPIGYALAEPEAREPVDEVRKWKIIACQLYELIDLEDEAAAASIAEESPTPEKAAECLHHLPRVCKIMGIPQ